MSHFVDHLRYNGFIAYAIENPEKTALYGGKDGCHKIFLLSGVGEIHYDHQVYKIEGSVLLISKPGSRCQWQLSKTNHPPYVCVFEEDFLETSSIGWTHQCDQFYSCKPVFSLSLEQETFVRSIFCRMIDEQRTSYPFKAELLQSQICILIHTAHQMIPLNTIVSSGFAPFSSAAFLELIELRFPLQGQILHFN